jgi:hypothetical protein
MMTAFALASCSNDENVLPQQPGENTAMDAKLSIQLDGINQSFTRSEGETNGTALLTNEDKISNAVIGIFSSTGRTKLITKATVGTDNKLETIACPAGDGCTVAVCTNVSDAAVSDLKAATDIIGFEHVRLNLAQTVPGGTYSNDNATYTTTGYQDGSWLPMYGETADVTITAGEEATATINVSRLVARVSLKSIGFSHDGFDLGTGTFQLKKITMFSAASQTWASPTSLWLSNEGNAAQSAATSMPDMNHYVYSFLGHDVTGNDKVYTQPFSDPGEAFLRGGYRDLLEEGENFYFYVFGNTVDDPQKQTQMMLVGDYKEDADATATTMYYAVPFKVEPNHTYDVTLTLLGKGSDTPTNNGTMTATVKVDAWEAGDAINGNVGE